MRYQLARTACAIGAFALLSVQALPQDSVIAKVINNEIPATVTLPDLKAEFKAVRLGVSQGSGGSVTESFVSMMGSLMGGAGSEAGGLGGMMAMGAMLLFGISWTKGETVKSGDQEFLITYKIELDQFLLDENLTEEPDLSKLPLRLSLVNLRSINTITPLPELTKEKYMELLQGGAGMSAPDAPTPVEAPITSDSPIEARKAATLSHLKQVSLAMIMYSSDYDDELPYAQSTATVKYVTMPYLKSLDTWTTYNPANSQFLFNMGVSGLSFYNIDMPAETVLYFESKAWEDGTRAVAFTDGHCRFLTESEFQAAMARSKFTTKRKGKPLPANYGIKELEELGKP